MIRIKIIEFIKKHKGKILDLGNKLIIVAIVVFVATIILSSFSKEDKTEEENDNVYKPSETIILGSNISEEQYKEDSNLVNEFLELCNNGKIQEAYGMLDTACKIEKYPSIKEFKKYYYDYIFNKERVCSIQAWISTSDYTVYKVRYSNNMLATGIYDEKDIYQDYITLNKKDNRYKISIGNFVSSEECNIITKTDEIEAVVTKKNITLTNEEYIISIKNNTDKTILLDNLKSTKTIWLKGHNDSLYYANTRNKFTSDLLLAPGQKKILTISFNKDLGSQNNSKNIEFLKVIKDYELYQLNENGYSDTIKIIINVED